MTRGESCGTYATRRVRINPRVRTDTLLDPYLSYDDTRRPPDYIYREDSPRGLIFIHQAPAALRIFDRLSLPLSLLCLVFAFSKHDSAIVLRSSSSSDYGGPQIVLHPQGSTTITLVALKAQDLSELRQAFRCSTLGGAKTRLSAFDRDKGLSSW